MQRRRIGVRALACAVAAGLLAAPAAGAAGSVTPFTRDFGGVAVGATSAPSTFVLTALCDDDPGLVFYQCANPGGDPPLPVDITVSTGFTQTNNCPASLPRSDPPNSASCTVTVTFAPAAVGPLSGLLTTGPTAENPVAAVSGTGVGPSSAPKAKKCKKKKSNRSAAVAKKKCRKKR